MASRHRSSNDLPPLTLTERVPERDGSRIDRAAGLAGRMIFGGYFVYSGIRHFTERAAMIDYARAKGVSWPEAAVFGSGAMLITGGLSLLTGVKPRVGASLVTAFLAGVTPTMHDYWNAPDAGQRMNDMVNFTKNLALIGGAALAASALGHRPYEAA